MDNNINGKLLVNKGLNAGFMMMEVLVTLVILAIGLLGLAGLQMRTSMAEMESYQRAQALVLAQDMADRMVANKSNAANYVGNDVGTGTLTDCSTLVGPTRAQMDLCEWAQSLSGASETSGGTSIGTLVSGRGCIATSGANQYLVVVVWQGMVKTAAPGSNITCGSGAYGPSSDSTAEKDKYRRAVAVLINTAPLN